MPPREETKTVLPTGNLRQQRKHQPIVQQNQQIQNPPVITKA